MSTAKHEPTDEQDMDEPDKQVAYYLKLTKACGVLLPFTLSKDRVQKHLKIWICAPQTYTSHLAIASSTADSAATGAWQSCTLNATVCGPRQRASGRAAATMARWTLASSQRAPPRRTTPTAGRCVPARPRLTSRSSHVWMWMRTSRRRRKRRSRQRGLMPDRLLPQQVRLCHGGQDGVSESR